MQENIVVFSDEYFKSIYSTGDGPSILALFNINKDKEEEAAVKFSDYAKDHIQYSEYDSLIQPIYGKSFTKQHLISSYVKIVEISIRNDIIVG